MRYPGRGAQCARMVVFGVALAACLGGLAGCGERAQAKDDQTKDGAAQAKDGAAPAKDGNSQAHGGPPQAPPVSVAPVVQRQLTDSEEFSGRLEAAEYVELRPRVAGTIDKVHFADGAVVRKGELLFTIDARPFAAEVARAEAQLAATRARAELAQSELKRAQSLLESQAISKSEADQLGAGARTSRADIQGGEAALRVARLNLDYTQVRAPIAGRASRAQITAGNLVGDQSVLTTIAGTSRIYAYFDSSEQTYLRVRAARGSGTPPKVKMALANEQGYPHEGSVDFVDNRLSPQTGAIRLRATFDNTQGAFTPGLAAKLRMEYGAPHAVTMVAERAIGTDQTKKLVYVVGADGRPQPREVKLGALEDGMRVVEGGVKPGENVVVDGLQRIVPGVSVQPQVLQVDARGMPIFPPPPGPPGAGRGPPGGASAGASGAKR